jgi:hypothetical protein
MLTPRKAMILTLTMFRITLKGGWMTVGILGFIAELLMISSIPNYDPISKDTTKTKVYNPSL